MTDSVRVISNIVKEYPDMYKLIVYKQPAVFTRSSCEKRNRELVNDFDYVPSVSSLNRTKTLVKDLVICNNFEWFCTFTFDPKKIDSFNLFRCWRSMSTWLYHQRERSKEKGIEFKYLIIPEKHKSGRWHFHALLSGYSSTLRESGVVTDSLRPIYNITSFRSGFTTAVRIDSSEGVSNYVTKYITKDFIKDFNHRRFFCSRNLLRPRKEFNSSLPRVIPPLFKSKVYENSYQFEFAVDKKNLCDSMDFGNSNVAQYRVPDNNN